jgi:nucleotide-binding universal stress UspA family protein
MITFITVNVTAGWQGKHTIRREDEMSQKKIIFPVDLAGSSYRIVSRVRSIARQSDAELHLAQVVETFNGYDTFFIPHRSLDLMESENIALAERDLEEFAEKYFQDFPRVKRVVLSGKPAEQIRNYILSEGIDMVILAAHERPFFQRTLLADMAERIAKVSPVPVKIIDPFTEDVTAVPAEVAAPATTSHASAA